MELTDFDNRGFYDLGDGFLFNSCIVTALWEGYMEFGTGVTSIPTRLGLLA